MPKRLMGNEMEPFELYYFMKHYPVQLFNKCEGLLMN